MPHTHGAVLQIAVIKSKAGVENDFFDAIAMGDFNLPREIFAHHLNGIDAEIEVANFADVFALHIAYDDRGIMRCDHPEQLIAAIYAREVQNVCPSVKASAGDCWLVSLD